MDKANTSAVFRKYPDGTILDEGEKIAHLRETSESPIEFQFAHSLTLNWRFLLIPVEAAYVELEPYEIAFIPQYKIGPYRLDFALFFRDKRNMQIKVNIECDGAAYHTGADAQKSDGERDQYMRGQGFHVWRYPGWMLHHAAHECAEEVDRAVQAMMVCEKPVFVFRSNKPKAEPTLMEWEAAFYAYWASDVWPHGFGKNPRERHWEHITDVIRDFNEEAL